MALSDTKIFNQTERRMPSCDSWAFCTL